MPLFSRVPHAESVRDALLDIVRQGKRRADVQAAAGRTTPFTINIVRLRPDDLVPAAIRIFPREVATKAEQSVDYAKALASSRLVDTMGAEDVDMYLAILLAVTEAQLRERSVQVRFYVSAAGSWFHQVRGKQNSDQKRWPDAEREFRAAIEYEQLFPGAGLIVNLNNLGQVLHAQGRLDEARGCFSEALRLFNQLAPGALDVRPSEEERRCGLWLCMTASLKLHDANRQRQ